MSVINGEGTDLDLKSSSEGALNRQPSLETRTKSPSCHSGWF